MKRTLTLAAILVVVTTITSGVMASEGDDLTSLSYIAYLERYATVQPATQESNMEAIINMPLVAGDRIDTAREARVEIQLADGSIVWLDEYSSLSFDAIAGSRETASTRTVLYLSEGTLITAIPEHQLAEEASRIDGAAGTIYLNRAGLYRVEALRNGNLRVEVWEGTAEAATPAGGVLVGTSSAAEVSAGRVDQVESQLTGEDDFARWVEQRRHVIDGESARRVDLRYSRQASMLDNYGSWVWVPDYHTWAWQPTVPVGWRPYTAGRWYYTPVGWSWIAYEPWGWLPYHYGSWFHHAGFGWVWAWDSFWGPAWVDWMWWPGHIGWCPRGYYSYYWWDWYHYDSHPRPHHQPPRGDVRPRPGHRAVPVSRDAPVPPSRFALDLEGVSDLSRVDPRGWNVVRTDDFTSPHLSRVVKPGNVALRRGAGGTAVVRSGPLMTEQPSRVRVPDALERTFRDIERQSPRDISSVLARSDDLEPGQAAALVKPTTTADLSRRAVADVKPTADRGPSRSVGSSGSSRATDTRRAAPNIYRPSRADLDSSATSSGSSLDRRPISRTATSVRPGSSTSRGSSGYVLRQTPRSPSSSSSSPSSRVVSPRSSSSRPVIVPRTSTSRISRSAGSSSSSRSWSSSPRSSSSSSRAYRSSGGSSSSSSRSSSSRVSSSSSSSSSSRSSSSSSSSSRSSSSPSRSGSSSSSRK